MKIKVPFFKLPELNTIYEVEAAQMCDRLDEWIAASIAEEEREEEATRDR
jgi:hypothetical protein